MSATEPHVGMSVEELEKLRDELCMSIERTERVLRKINELLAAGPPERRPRAPSPTRTGDSPRA